jgi:hypothetical protein
MAAGDAMINAGAKIKEGANRAVDALPDAQVVDPYSGMQFADVGHLRDQAQPQDRGGETADPGNPNDKGSGKGKRGETVEQRAGRLADQAGKNSHY